MSRRFWIWYPLALAAGMLFYWLTPPVQDHPLALLLFLLLVGGPEVYYLGTTSAACFHWFFQSKPSVVNELRAFLLAYLVFLVSGIIVNLLFKNQGFIVIVALILPIVALIMGFLHELIIFLRERNYLPK